VVGASTGFGLASRISSAFGSDAAIGVFFEKPPTAGRTASQVGTILLLLKRSHNRFICQKCQRRCFSDEIKKQTLDL
jgi:enoyl-[acyl-carrier protein] reductase/trans-2-enoyl-CoA reductase (NAD+)